MAGLGPQLNPVKKKTAPAPPLKVESRIGIRTPAEVAWEVLRDIDTWGEWSQIYPQAAGQIKIGAPLTLTLALPGEAHREIAPKIIDWVPQEQIMWGDIIWRGWGSSVRYFELEEVTKTACFFSNGELFYNRISKWYGKQHRRAMRQGFEAMSEALKAKCEALWQPPA